MADLGKLARPYPVEVCANAACPHDDLDRDAYVYRDLEGGKLVIFCDDCARHAEMNAPERFKVVPL